MATPKSLIVNTPYDTRSVLGERLSRSAAAIDDLATRGVIQVRD
jgi:hypothetical protein